MGRAGVSLAFLLGVRTLLSLHVPMWSSLCVSLCPGPFLQGCGSYGIRSQPHNLIASSKTPSPNTVTF